MALQPSSFTGRDVLQPGARGEIFQADMPGYRGQGDRINRTNNRLNVSPHDVPNIKYQFDYRLPVLFRYGWAYGYNQMVIPKGRIVAVDPYMDLVDFDMRKAHNTLTLANGGVPVRLREHGDTYRDDNGSPTALVSGEKQGQQVSGVNKEWVPLIGMDAAYTSSTYRPFRAIGENGEVTFKGARAQLNEAGLDINPETGKVVDSEGVTVDTVRPGNIPIGIMQRNEYTRDDDAFNGMMPGPVLTDALVELPWFAYKDKAEQNPWGSAYGNLFPGALVKSDENGRFVLSPLSIESEVANMTIAEYEAERQQVVGQVYSVNNDLLPEGAAKWATWALSDRLNFDEFNPEVYPRNNRRGEDAVARSPYKSTGEYPGYPYDKAYTEHDLHMLASTARSFSTRLAPEYQVDNLGIPGLTDGYNAVVRDFPPQVAGRIYHAGGNDYVDMFFRTSEVNLEKNSLQIAVGNSAFVPCVEGAMLTVNGEQFLRVKYADEKQGIVVLEITDKDKADAVLQTMPQGLEVKFKFRKRGMSGVPTFLDWDGCCGSVKILLTK